MSPTDLTLTVHDLSLARGNRTLFSGLAVTLAAGEALALTGPNGSGKTSLLRAIAGLLTPAQGTIQFSDKSGPLDPDIVRSRHLHWFGHLDGLKPEHSAADALDFQVAWSGGHRQAARGAAERLGLTDLLSLPVRRLSAGQRRRLALARLIACPRPIWLLDEPLAPLDVSQRTLIGIIMTEHLDQGGLILAAVHDPLPVAARPLDLNPVEAAG